MFQPFLKCKLNNNFHRYIVWMFIDGRLVQLCSRHFTHYVIYIFWCLSKKIIVLLYHSKLFFNNNYFSHPIHFSHTLFFLSKMPLKFLNFRIRTEFFLCYGVKKKEFFTNSDSIIRKPKI